MTSARIPTVVLDDRGAGIPHTAAGTRATLEAQPVSRTRLHGNIDAVPILGPRRAIVGLERVVEVLLPELAGVDVIRRELISPTPRQPGIERGRHSVRRVVGRSGRPVVGHEEIAEPAAIVANLDRRARQHFLLNRPTHLPIPRPNAPPLHHRGVDGRERERVPEVLIAPRAAFRLRHRIHQIAVGHEVVVQVVPGAVRLHLKPRRRAAVPAVERRVPEDVVGLVGGRLQVLAGAELQRGLAVAEQVVGRAHARRDVLVAAHAVGPGEGDRGRTPQRRHRRSVALSRVEAVRVVEAQRPLHRQPPGGPLILREDARGTTSDR